MNTNESAFPEVITESKFAGGAPYGDTYSYGGMTKLEYFTAAAMQGFMASLTEQRATGRMMDDSEMECMAAYCVKFARATLNELQKQQS